MAQLVGMLGAGLLGDIIGVMLINVQTIVYILAGMMVLAATARGLNMAATEETA